MKGLLLNAFKPFGSQDRKNMSWGARYQNSSQDISLICVVGEKEAFCVVNVCFYLEGLDWFGLVGTDRVLRWFGRFWPVPVRIRVAG